VKADPLNLRTIAHTALAVVLLLSLFALTILVSV